MSEEVFSIPGIRLSQGIGFRMEPVSPNSVLWRCRIALRRGPWTTLYPAHEGFASLGEAIEATDARLEALQAAQEDASAAEVVHFLRAKRLWSEAVAGPEGEEEVWTAETQEGARGSGETPEAAVRAAKAARLTDAAERGKTSNVRRGR